MSIPATASQGFSAATGRPISTTVASVVLVRPSRSVRHGSFGELGSLGCWGTGSSSIRSSTLSPATSERRRPPEANAVSSRARTRRSTRRSAWQPDSNWSRISPVIAYLLLRCRGRAARTASRRALLIDGSAKNPLRPRQRVRIDHEVSRRRTVSGACGPVAFSSAGRATPPRRPAACRARGRPCV